MKELDGDFSARERIKHQQQRPALGGRISGRKIKSVAVGRIGLHSHGSMHRAGRRCLGIRRIPNTKYHYCEKYGIQFHGNGLRNQWLSTNNTQSREAATGEIDLKSSGWPMPIPAPASFFAGSADACPSTPLLCTLDTLLLCRTCLHLSNPKHFPYGRAR